MISNCGNHQVIAPFLVTLRVANRSEVTSRAILTGSSIQFESQVRLQGETDTLPDGSSVGVTKVDAEATDNDGVGVENTTDEVPP